MKQVIVLRADLNMSPGKAIAQGCHASTGAALVSDKKNQWYSSGLK